MKMTEPAGWLNEEHVGYMVNAEFSNENKKTLETITNNISRKFGNAVFVMPTDSLHITLMDWIAPLADYEGADKTKLFKKIQPSYNAVFADIVSASNPITIHFDKILVSPGTIFIVGKDSGEFQSIRDRFVETVDLLPNTKPPPTIIHCSISRFTQPIETNAVNDYISQQSIDLTQVVKDFRLVNSHREPLLDFETLKRYTLGKV